MLTSSSSSASSLITILITSPQTVTSIHIMSTSWKGICTTFTSFCSSGTYLMSWSCRSSFTFYTWAIYFRHMSSCLTPNKTWFSWFCSRIAKVNSFSIRTFVTSRLSSILIITCFTFPATTILSSFNILSILRKSSTWNSTSFWASFRYRMSSYSISSWTRYTWSTRRFHMSSCRTINFTLTSLLSSWTIRSIISSSTWYTFFIIISSWWIISTTTLPWTIGWINFCTITCIDITWI